MQIRVLTGSDAQAYWDFRLEALEREPEAFSSSPEEHLRLNLDEIRSRLGHNPRLGNDSGDQFVLAAFDGDQMIATAGFYRQKGPKNRHKGGVWGVYVTQQARGKGLGRQLMQALLDQATKIDGIEQILISVMETQAAAISLYRSLGFEPFGREPRAVKVGDRYLDELHMVRFTAKKS